MAITPETIRLVNQLKAEVGSITDAFARKQVAAWVTAWADLGPVFLAGIDDVLAGVEAGRWPGRAAVTRSTRLLAALDVAQGELARLARLAGLDIAEDLTAATTAAAEAQAAIVASQLPPAMGTVAEITATFGKLNPGALSAIVTRSTQQVTSLLRPLSHEATRAMTTELIRGVAVGDNPRETARRMLKRVEGRFNGGLSRAMTISRTEVIDAYREATRESHLANADVLRGWVWTASLDRRCCPSCFSKHGTEYPLTTPGPWDHVQGRCARVPVTKSWAELGFPGIKEPPSVLPDAQATFAKLPRADQLQIMGPARLAALDSGKAQWADLAVLKRNPAWRDSFATRPVKDLLAV